MENDDEKKYRNILYTISLVLMSACGGSGGNPGNNTVNNVTNESPAGIWEGTGVSSNNNTGKIAGLVSSNGKAFFFTSLPALIYGNVSVSGNNFSFNGDVYEDCVDCYITSLFTSPPCKVTMSGTVSSGSSINASYSTCDDNGKISLLKAGNSIGVYDRSANLRKLEGIWNDAVTDNEGTWVFNIQNNGSFSGMRVTDNCSMNGNFSTINSTKNEYSVAATVFACNQFDGNYSGLAFTSDVNTFTDNVINFVIVNGQHAGWFEASKQ